MNSVQEKLYIPTKKQIVATKTLGKYSGHIPKALGQYNKPIKKRLGVYC